MEHDPSDDKSALPLCCEGRESTLLKKHKLIISNGIIQTTGENRKEQGDILRI